MGWIRVSDDFYDNAKMSDVGPLGVALHVAAMGFCNRNLTDGYFKKGKARGFLDFDGIGITTATASMCSFGVDGDDAAKLVIEWMVAADLWHEKDHDCDECHARDDGGEPAGNEYLVHDYLKYQPSKFEVEEKAEANRKRVEAWRQSQKMGKAGSNGQRNAVGNALHTPLVSDGYAAGTNPPNPNPTPTVFSKENTSRGGGGSGVPHQSARPDCPLHEENSEEPCPDCMKRRKWDDEHEDQLAADELKAKRDSKWLQENCFRCHGTNTYETKDGRVVPCRPHQHPDHQEVSA